MKYFLYLLTGLALMSIVFNATYLNLNNLFVGDSKTAVIGILASICVLLLVVILMVSKKIEQKFKELEV